MALEVDHVGLAVRDTAVVAAFYEQALGLWQEHQEVVGDGELQLTFLAADDGRASLELLEPLAPDTSIARFVSERGPGMHHVCFRVADIRAELARLAALGVELIDTAPRVGSRGRLIAFVHPRAAHGVLVELCQHGEAG